MYYGPRRSHPVNRGCNLNSTSLKWEAVCAKLKQMKSPSPTKTFWKKNLRIVKVDPCEILDRVLYCKCGLVEVYQDAINLTAMDKRQFAPPIEGSGYERVIYMANTCETFKIHPKTTARLIKYGYKSITLLSMAEGNFEVERGLTGDRLHHCLSVLNDKRSHILDPCYSLQRLINARRKHWFSMKKYQYLDLAHLDAKILPPPPREYKLPEPMIARTTFKNFDNQLVFGPRKPCNCNEKEAKIRGILKSASSSSGYSSGQDSLDSPDSLKGFFSQVCQIELPKSMEAPILSEPPPPMKKVSPQPVPKPRRLQRPFGPNVICTFKNQDPSRGIKMHCPRPNCKWQLYSNQIEDHCTRYHRMKTERAFAYQEVYSIGKGSQSYNKPCGGVNFKINAIDVISDDNKIQLWWGPFPFVFDNVTFYQLVYKKTDNEPPRNESQIVFWIWTALPKHEAFKYKYEIHLDTTFKRDNPNFCGTVQSLDTSSSDLIQQNLRSIVYFSQSYIRKTLRFTHNYQQPPPKTLDMKYTVKIMRQSL